MGGTPAYPNSNVLIGAHCTLVKLLEKLLSNGIKYLFGSLKLLIQIAVRKFKTCFSILKCKKKCKNSTIH